MSGKNEEQAAREARRLAGALAGLPRPEVPDDILPQVMARIEPKRPSVSRRCRRLVRRLVFGSRARGVMAGALAAVTLVVTGWLLGARLARGPLSWQAPVGREIAAQPVQMRLAGSQAGQGKEVTFVARLPGAREVAVIGSFNDWAPGRHVMRKAQGGDVFTLTLTLPAGRYVYAFLVDGALLPDAGALLQEDDGFGNTNSVLIIDDGENRQPGRGNHERPL